MEEKVERTKVESFRDDNAQVLAIWSKYEDVAMHFNDLLMKWRLQAIGGLAALITLAGSVVGKIQNHDARYWGVILLATTFLFVWIGLATLDLFYYRKLLEGAVEELLSLESQIHIKMSTTIERFAKAGGKHAPVFFYVLGAAPLIFILGYGIIKLNSQPSRADAVELAASSGKAPPNQQ